MTLLDATATLIDCAKTWAPEDRAVMRAVTRMEKRLRLLKLRQVKARRRLRSRAWEIIPIMIPQCPGCSHVFLFGEFVRTAEIDGRGFVRRFECPECRREIARLESRPGTLPASRCMRYVFDNQV